MSRRDRELDEELRHHRESLEAEYRERGLSEEEARFAALRDLGGIARTKELYRDQYRWTWLETAWHDLRFAVRSLWQNPGFTATSVFSLAFGIAAATGVFSVMYSILLEPPPYKDPSRLGRLTYLRAKGYGAMPLSGERLVRYQELESTEGVFGTDLYYLTMTDGDLPRLVMANRLSLNAFDLLGVAPLLGRYFRGPVTLAEPPREVVLTYKFWQDQFGGSPGAVGRTLHLDNEAYTVIGVMPPRFRWESAEIFVPARLAFYREPSLNVFARIKPDVAVAVADAEALRLHRSLSPTTPADAKLHFSTRREQVNPDLQQTLYIFFAVVLALLLVGCLNVSILLLARGSGRHTELALRAALGASRGRLAAHLLAESLLIAAMGGALGIVLALPGLRLIRYWMPPEMLPPEATLGIDGPVLGFGVAAALLTGLLFGFAPAWRFSLPGLSELIQTGSARLTQNAGGRRIQQALVALQVSLTVVLLTGAGAALSTLVTRYRAELGYNPHGLLRVSIPIQEGSYATFESRLNHFEGIRAAVAAIPGVEAAAYGPYMAPFSLGANYTEVEGSRTEPLPLIATQDVSPSYFSAIQLPLRAGRLWTESEEIAAANKAVVSESFARTYLADQNPLGKRVRFPNRRTGQWETPAKGINDWFEIVGVVADFRNQGPQNAPTPCIYVPATMTMGDNRPLLIRASQNNAALVQAIREAVRSVSATQAIVPETKTGEEMLRDFGWRQHELSSSIALAFAGVALVLAATGLFSVVAYTTARRTREFGIRLALGATRSDIARLVLAPAARMVAIGLILGAAFSYGGAKLVSRWIETRVDNPWVIASVFFVLAAAAALASLVPAARAIRTDPSDVLREQ